MDHVHPKDGQDQNNRQRAAHADQRKGNPEVGPGHVSTEPEARVARDTDDYSDVPKLHRRVDSRRPLVAIGHHEAGRCSGSIDQTKADNEGRHHNTKDRQTEFVRKCGRLARVGSAENRPRQEVDSHHHQDVRAQIQDVATTQDCIPSQIHGIDVQCQRGSYRYSGNYYAVVRSPPDPWQEAQNQSPNDRGGDGLDHPNTLSNDLGS